jgi:hypothetical protein
MVAHHAFGEGTHIPVRRFREGLLSGLYIKLSRRVGDMGDLWIRGFGRALREGRAA